MSKTVRAVIAAMLAAMACIATMVITVPTAGGGYVNIGDSIVILSGWLLGGVYGALAAGIGSALADVLSGYAFYAPATFVIKALMAVVVGLNTKMFKNMANRIVPVVISSALAELVMLTGYFICRLPQKVMPATKIFWICSSSAYHSFFSDLTDLH